MSLRTSVRPRVSPQIVSVAPLITATLVAQKTVGLTRESDARKSIAERGECKLPQVSSRVGRSGGDGHALETDDVVGV